MAKNIKISGVDLPHKKQIAYSLRYIYGIGTSLAFKICDHMKIDPTIRTEALSDSEFDALRDYIESNYTIEGDLKRDIIRNIKRLSAIKCYRGLRHARGLPVRGQRTKNNARTRKGKKKTVSSSKK